MADASQSPQQLSETFQHPVEPAAAVTVDRRNHDAITSNNAEWDVAKQFGITQASLKQHHPELIAAENTFVKNVKHGVVGSMLITGSLAIAAAVALPVALRKAVKNGWLRALLVVGGGGVGGAAGGYISAHTFAKPTIKAMAEYSQIENKALTQEIEKEWAHAQATQQMPGEAIERPAEANGMLHTQNLKPRDASFVAQDKKESEQPATTGLQQS